jgi:hypothetical protein
MRSSFESFSSARARPSLAMQKIRVDIDARWAVGREFSLPAVIPLP